MLTPPDITANRVDITTAWRRATGDRTSRAFACLRAGSICSVIVPDRGGDLPLTMDRSGAALFLTHEGLRQIEMLERGRPWAMQ